MSVDTATFNGVTHEIIGAAIEVHRTIGPGLLETTYLECLQWELGARKLGFVTERQVPVTYKGTVLDVSYRIDLANVPRLMDGVKRLINSRTK